MKFSKVCNTIAAVVGYGTLAVAAYTVASALKTTIEDEIARKQFEALNDVAPTYTKNTTMKEWLDNQNGGEYTHV